MNVLSLEDSLNMLSSTTTKSPSPQPVKKRGRRSKKVLSSPTNISPVRIPNEADTKKRKPRTKKEPKKEKKEKKKEKKEVVEELTDHSNDKLEKTEESNDEVEIREVTETNVSSNKIIASPKRQVPVSPVREEKEEELEVENIPSINISELLENLRYKILRYLRNKSTGKVDYIICYDANGQLVFIETRDNVEYESPKLVNVEELDETEDEMDSYVLNFKEKMSVNINGLVIFNGTEYTILKKNDLGEIITKKYQLVSESKKLNLPQIYSLLSLEEIQLDGLTVLRNTNRSYKIIQDEQWNNSKTTLSEIKKSIDLLNSSISDFESEYLKYINGIMNDWRTLSKHSNTFYKKFAKNELTSGESENFKLISLNMLSRFETFSRSINVIENLSEIVNDVYKSSIHTNEITEMLRERNKRIGKILQEDEIEIMS